jgi:hypothetical protein
MGRLKSRIRLLTRRVPSRASECECPKAELSAWPRTRDGTKFVQCDRKRRSPAFRAAIEGAVPGVFLAGSRAGLGPGFPHEASAPLFTSSRNLGSSASKVTSSRHSQFGWPDHNRRCATRGVEARAAAWGSDLIPDLFVVRSQKAVSIDTYTSTQQHILEEDPAQKDESIRLLLIRSARIGIDDWLSTKNACRSFKIPRMVNSCFRSATE